MVYGYMLAYNNNRNPIAFFEYANAKELRLFRPLLMLTVSYAITR